MKTIRALLAAITLIVLLVSPTTKVSARTPVYQSQTGYLVTMNMPVMVFPLTRDGFYRYLDSRSTNTLSTVRTFVLSGVGVGYSGLYLMQDPTNAEGMLRYTIFHHTTGSQLIAVGIYDRGVINSSGIYVPTTKYYSSDEENSILNHTILGDYYPNKIINDLIASRSIMEYQQEHGPFIAGQEYSLFDVLGLEGASVYVPGLTSQGDVSVGGGICIVATNFMKLVTLMESTITERWSHATSLKYFENPLSAGTLGINETDATIEYPYYDFRWVQRTTGYITVSAAVMSDGSSVFSDLGDYPTRSDALELITFRFVQASDYSVQTWIQNLQNLENHYRMYRASHTPSAISLDGESKLLSSVLWERGDDLSTLAQTIVPDERVSRFAHELSSDPFLVSLASLRDKINALDPSSTVLVGNYLHKSAWYSQETKRLGDPLKIKQLDSALSHLNGFSNAWSGQKIQCVGLVVLLSAMNSNVVNIGGIDFVNAKDLVPQSIRGGSKLAVDQGGYLAIPIDTIDEVRVGDVGVRYYTGIGHVFVVVGKKSFGGQTVLLVAAANQTGEGRVYIFEVDKSNFDTIFGEPSFYKVVLRK